MGMFDVQSIEIMAPRHKVFAFVREPAICRAGPMRLCPLERAAPGSRRPRERSMLLLRCRRMPRRAQWIGG